VVIFPCDEVCFVTAVEAAIRLHGDMIDMACPAGNKMNVFII